jgi:hypothetical protein
MANTHLSRTPSVEPTSRYKGTLSVWVKRGKADAESFIFYGFESNSNKMKIDFKSDSSLQINTVQAASNRIVYETNRKFRDVNAWYHIVVAIDTTLATAGDRVRLYVNGVEETSFSTETHPAQNSLHMMTDNGTPIYIGSENGGNYFNGSMSHYHLIDGTQYTASDFGETDATTGEWKIKTSPSVTYGNNGFWILKDGNSVTDASPNTNNLTVSSGTLTKTEDCPSNVFSTWSPLHHSTQSFSNVALKNGNTTFDNNESSNSVYPQGYSTLAASSGKYYLESKLISTNGNTASFIGISGAVTTEAYIGENAYTYAYRENGVVRNNDTNGSTYTSYGVNDIIQIAVDLDNNKLYFGINGTWVNSGDPTSGATGTGAVYTITAPSSTPHGVYHFTIGDTSSPGTFEHATNFGNGYFGTTAVSSAGTNASGNGIFEYDVPTGYTALSTKGLNL